jgi:hypothetical protein
VARLVELMSDEANDERLEADWIKFAKWVELEKFLIEICWWIHSDWKDRKKDFKLLHSMTREIQDYLYGGYTDTNTPSDSEGDEDEEKVSFWKSNWKLIWTDEDKLK